MNAATLDVAQMIRVWCAVVEGDVSAMGENPTVSVECQPSQDYSTQETTVSVHMIIASILTYPTLPSVVEMECVILAHFKRKLVLALNGVLVHIVPQLLDNVTLT